MLCDDCIKILANSLSPNATKVFNILIEKGELTRKEIQYYSKLSYAFTGKAIEELRYKLFINKEDGQGRSCYHWLTKVGVRLVELSQKEEVG